MMRDTDLIPCPSCETGELLRSAVFYSRGSARAICPQCSADVRPSRWLRLGEGILGQIVVLTVFAWLLLGTWVPFGLTVALLVTFHWLAYSNLARLGRVAR